MSNQRNDLNLNKYCQFFGECIYGLKATIQKRAPNVLLLLMIFFSTSLEATDYYVATDGNDNHAGSMAAPFKTIGAASNLMIAGDNCFIRQGTYYETISPANSGNVGNPITYQAYGTEIVTINAANVVSGWTVSSNNIYVASLTTDLGPWFNQVFVNGNMMNEARYPNTGTDLLAPTLALATAGTNSVNLTVSRPANYWVGATVWGIYASKWTSQVATVTASSAGGNLTLSNKTGPWFSGSGSAYIRGIFGELDSAGEWFISSGNLYLWAPGNADPNTLKVEAKSRPWCINLSGKSNIKINRLNLFGASIKMDSNRCEINDCQIKYLSHFTGFNWSGYASDGKADSGHNGIWIKGDENVIRGCTIKCSAGSGIVIVGGNNLITRSTITEMDYSGTYSCPITIRTSGKGGNEISFCSLGNAGRDIIQLYGSNADIIKFNDIYTAGKLCHDLGMIYAWGNDGKNTRIMYNWIHDYLPPGPGIYFDNYTQNYIADHNVIWNCGSSGVRFNEPNYNLYAYNNTLYNCKDVGTDTFNSSSIRSDPDTWTLGNTRYTISKNNLFLNTTPSTQLIDSANNDFRLKSGSISINSGNIIPGFTDEYVGSAPDKGAYEDGRSRWTAGVNGVEYVSINLPSIETISSTNVGNSFATLNGNLVTTGTSATEVRLYWGNNDGGSNTNSWTNVVQLDPGTNTVKNYSTKITGLTQNSPYYFVYYAKNATGESWGGSKSFERDLNNSLTLSANVDMDITSGNVRRLTGTTLQAGNETKIANNGSRSFLKFDLSGIQSDWQITSATLRLYQVTGTGAVNGDAFLHNVTQNWQKDTIIYHHPVSTSIFQVPNSNAIDQFKELDVTTTIRNYVTSANSHYGFCIRGYDQWGSTAKYFVSSRGAVAQRPELLIKYIINTAPSATPSSIDAYKNKSSAFILQASDAENNSLTYALLTNPMHGSLTGIAPNLIYAPESGFTGSDNLVFKVNDGKLDSNTAVVSFTVFPSNDPPVAHSQSVSCSEDSALAITLTGTDIDNNNLNYFIVNAPIHGILSGTAPNIIYTPTANYSGSDSFTFKVNDGTIDCTTNGNVNITVTAVVMGGLTLSTNALSVNENGSSNTFTAVLTTIPSANVTVVFNNPDVTENSLSNNVLIFTPSNWNLGQTVTATGVDDAIADGNVDVVLGVSVISADTAYNGLVVTGPKVTTLDDAIVVTVETSSYGTTVPAGAQNFDPDGSLTLLATANANYHFTGWSLNSGTGTFADANASGTSFIPSNVSTVTANFALNTYVISYINDNTAGATLIGTTTQTIAHGSNTSAVTAVAPAGYTFSRWSMGDATISNLVTLTASNITAAGTYKAEFTANTVVMDLSTGSIEVSEGSQNSFSVKLSAQPISTTVITIGKAGDSDLSVSPVTLSFSTDNWSANQIVAVSASQDVDILNGTATLTLASVGLPSVTVTVTEIDDDIAGLTLSPSALSVSENGSSNTFSVDLKTIPTDNVIVVFNNPDDTEVVLSNNVLTFTPANWNLGQTVAATGVDDAIADGNIDVVLGVSVISSDLAYNGLVVSGPTVTTLDDAIVVTVNVSGYGTTVPAGSQNFDPDESLTLLATANANYHFTGWSLNSGTGTFADATASNTSFMPSNVSTVTANFALNTYVISYINDNTAGATLIGTTTQTIAHGSNTSAVTAVAPAGYTFSRWSMGGATISNLVTLTASNITAAGTYKAEFTANTVVMVLSTGAIEVSEGSQNSFSVKLSAQPSNTTVVTIGKAGDSDLSVSPVSLSFTTDNWAVAQTVTVSASQDVDVLNGTAELTLASVGLASVTVAVTEIDDDIAGLSLFPSAFSVSENGSSNTITVGLNNIPTANVIVVFNNPDDTEVVLSNNVLTFTPANWNLGQTVTAIGVDDAIADGNIDVVLGVSVISADLAYNGLVVSGPTVTTLDDAIVVTVDTSGNGTTVPTGAKIFDPDGTLKLLATANPNYHFTGWSMTSGTGTFEDANASNTSFMPSNVSTVTANFALNTYVLTFVHDNTAGAILIGATTQTIPHGANASAVTAVAPVGYTFSRWRMGGATISTLATLTASNITAAGTITAEFSANTVAIVSGTASLAVNEGSQNSFGVKLSAQPISTTVVTIAKVGDSDLWVSPVTLSFTPDNWAMVQTVSVSASQDVDVSNGTAALTLASVGLASVTVAATEIDDDVVSLILDKTTIVVPESGTTMFSVQLSAAADTTVRLSLTGDSDISISPTSLIFTRDNWNISQMVTVSAASDKDVINGTASIALSGPGVNAMVSVTEKDDDMIPVIDQGSTVTVVMSEEGSSTAFALNLSATDIGDTLSWSVSSEASHGSASINSAGVVEYLPRENFNGTDSFVVKVTDSLRLTDSIAVNVTVLAVNDAPTVDTLTLKLDEDNSVLVPLIYNDIDGDSLTVTTTEPSLGRLSGALPNLIYTPAANVFGSDNFTVSVNDGILTTTANVWITVNAVNDAPVIHSTGSLAKRTDMNMPISFLVQGTDIEFSSISWAVSNVAHGTASLVASANTAEITYTPQSDFYGSDSLTITAMDSEGATDISVVTISVRPPNRAPVLADPNPKVTMSEDGFPKVFALNLGASDPDGDALITSITSAASHGVASVGPNGIVGYMPSSDWHGVDNFVVAVKDSYGLSAFATVSVTVLPVNDAPTLAGKAITVEEYSENGLGFDLLGYVDIDGDKLNYLRLTDLPAHGQLKLSGTLMQVGDKLSLSDIQKSRWTFLSKKGQRVEQIGVVAHDGISESLKAVITVKVLDLIAPTLKSELNATEPMLSFGTVSFSFDEDVLSNDTAKSATNPANYLLTGSAGTGRKVASISGNGAGPYTLSFDSNLKDGSLSITVWGITDLADNAVKGFTLNRIVDGLQLLVPPTLRVGSRQVLLPKLGVEITSATSSDVSVLKAVPSWIEGLQPGPVTLTLVEKHGSTKQIDLTVNPSQMNSIALRLPDYGSNARFSLVNFPVNVATFGELRILIESKLGKIGANNWMAYTYTGVGTDPYDVPTDESPTNSTTSYWLAVIGQRQLDFTSFGPASNDIVTRVLKPGWNLTGNPYTTAVSIDRFMVRQVDGLVVLSSQGQTVLGHAIHVLNDHHDGYYSATILKPGQGGWIYNGTSSDQVVIINPASTLQSKPMQTKLESESEPPAIPGKKLTVSDTPAAANNESLPTFNSSGGGGCLLR